MKDLTKGNIYKTFILFAIPMVLSGMLSQCYHVVNTVIAGKLLGEAALGAIGALSPLETFINSIFWGYGTGVGVYTAHLFGAKEYYRMKCVIVNNFKLMSASLLLLSVLFIVFRYPVYKFLNIDPDLLSECDRYFIIAMMGKVFVLFAINCVAVVNAMGDSAFPFFMSLLSTLLNIGISSCSVIVFKMGVSGIAVGNVLAAIIVSIFYIVKFASCFKKVGVYSEKIKSVFSEIKTTARYSVLSCLQQSAMYFSGIILSPMINNLGRSASASYIVSYRIYDINAAVYQNSSKTLGNYTAQCFGAKKYKLMKKGIRVGFLQSVLFVMPFLLTTIFAARWASGLFFGADVSPDAVNYTVNFLRWGMPLLILNIIANLYHNFFRGIGNMSALFITTVVGAVARIAASLILIPYFGIYGYYAGWIISWFADALIGASIYFFSKRCRSLRFYDK